MQQFSVPQYFACFVIALLTTISVAVGEQSPDSKNLIPNPEFHPGRDGSPQHWDVWSPRPELLPGSGVVSGPEGLSLAMRADQFSQTGRWMTRVREIEGGSYYAFDVSYRCADVESEDVSVPVMLTWYESSDADRGELQRDYIDSVASTTSWQRRARVLQAPPKARSVRIELGLRWTEAGSVSWREPRLVRIALPAPRRVRLATTYLRPQWSSGTVESHTQMMAEILDKVGPEKPDLVLLSEIFINRGTGPLAQTAQTIPGPLTRMLSEKAEEYQTYVVASLNEVEEGRFYNTAVLIDREGEIVGKYRKVHLTLVEADQGIVPGSEYPVFDTDFGRIGIMICWDNWFVEPARALRLQGAEILLLPLVGDTAEHWEVISRARAIDNGVFFVASANGGKSPSCIINPTGEVLAETRTSPEYVLREVDLNQELRLGSLSAGSRGEGRSLYVNERRPDTYSSLSEDRPGP